MTSNKPRTYVRCWYVMEKNKGGKAGERYKGVMWIVNRVI